MSAVTEPTRLAANKPSFVVCEGNEAAARTAAGLLARPVGA